MPRFYRIQTGLFRKYLFSLDHKVIGLQYALTSLVFLLIGFGLAIVFRWQLAYPGRAVPFVGSLCGELNAPGGILLPEFYNQLVGMHGTIMVFLAVVPLSVGAFGNYLVPLQIGAPDMAFPRLNMSSYWLYLAGGLVMVASFFVPQGAANSGWTSYPPLADFVTMGQTFSWSFSRYLRGAPASTHSPRSNKAPSSASSPSNSSGTCSIRGAIVSSVARSFSS